MASHNKYLAAFNQLVLPTISKVQRLMGAVLETEIKQHDLTMAEFRIVGLLMGEDKGLMQKTLAAKLDISAPSLSATIASLEAKKWIQRINDETDLRVKRIQIHAKADFSSIANVITLLEGQATKGISQKDLKTTHATLNKIILNITQTSGEIK